jgi:hypothetical protein
MSSIRDFITEWVELEKERDAFKSKSEELEKKSAELEKHLDVSVSATSIQTVNLAKEMDRTKKLKEALSVFREYASDMDALQRDFQQRASLLEIDVFASEPDAPAPEPSVTVQQKTAFVEAFVKVEQKTEPAPVFESQPEEPVESAARVFFATLLPKFTLPKLALPQLSISRRWVGHLIFVALTVPFALMFVLGQLAEHGIYVEFFRQFWQPWPSDDVKTLASIGVPMLLGAIWYVVMEKRTPASEPEVAGGVDLLSSETVPPPLPDDEPMDEAEDFQKQLDEAFGGDS